MRRRKTPWIIAGFCLALSIGSFLGVMRLGFRLGVAEARIMYLEESLSTAIATTFGIHKNEETRLDRIERIMANEPLLLNVQHEAYYGIGDVGESKKTEK